MLCTAQLALLLIIIHMKYPYRMSEAKTKYTIHFYVGEVLTCFFQPYLPIIIVFVLPSILASISLQAVSLFSPSELGKSFIIVCLLKLPLKLFFCLFCVVSVEAIVSEMVQHIQRVILKINIRLYDAKPQKATELLS